MIFPLKAAATSFLSIFGSPKGHFPVGNGGMAEKVDIDMLDKAGCCCDGISLDYEVEANVFEKKIVIKSFHALREQLDCLYKVEPDADVRLNKIQSILSQTHFNSEEFMRYARSSHQADLPYTRNMVYTNKNYSLLMLVWKKGSESKIHSHPCDGCILMPISGSVVETVYEKQGVDANEEPVYKFVRENTLNTGESGKIRDSDEQVHKIGSPDGAISLHIYTPPFATCNYWTNEAEGEVESRGLLDSEAKQATMSWYSIHGNVVPEELEKTYDLLHYI